MVRCGGGCNPPVSTRRLEPPPPPPGPDRAVWGIGTPLEGPSASEFLVSPPLMATETPNPPRTCLGRLGDRDAQWGG